MKKIANVFILALTLSLGISLNKNYSLFNQLSIMQDYMTYSADVLKIKNDHKEKYNWNKCRLLKNTLFNYQTRPELFTQKGKLIDEYFSSIDDELSGTIRFYLEQERRAKLNGLSPNNFDSFFQDRYMKPSLDFKDELYLGFHETVLDNCIYEVTINGVPKEFNDTGVYECKKAPKLLIDLKRISINPKSQNLDTICVTKFISRA